MNSEGKMQHSRIAHTKHQWLASIRGPNIVEFRRVPNGLEENHRDSDWVS